MQCLWGREKAPAGRPSDCKEHLHRGIANKEWYNYELKITAASCVHESLSTRGMNPGKYQTLAHQYSRLGTVPAPRGQYIVALETTIEPIREARCR
jgi:hypothetical protein